MNKVILGGYVKIKTGKLDANASEENGKYPFFTCAREISRINTFAFDCECVLVAGNGELNVKYYEGRFNAYQRTYVIESKDSQVLSTKYLYYFIDSYMEKLRNGAIGGVIKYIKLNHLTDIELPLPDLETQDKIVAVLDKAKSLIEKRQQTIYMFDELVRGTFLDMFGDPFINPIGWKLSKIGSKIDFITSGSRGWAKYYNQSGTGSLFLRINNLGYNELLLENTIRVNEPNTSEAIRTKVNSGDVLLSITADIGRTAVVPFDFEKAFVNQHIAILRPKISINPYFLSAFLSSNGGQVLLTKYSKGAAKAGLNFDDIKSVKIFDVDMDLQKKFEVIYKKIQGVKNNLHYSIFELQNLLGGLSQSAFNGGLQFNTAVDLEILMENDYNFFKKHADKKAVQLLLDRMDKNILNKKKFYEEELYDKAKMFVFNLLEDKKIEQVYEQERIQLVVK